MDNLNSEMPGTEEFEGMSEEELGNSLPRQGEAPKGESSSAAPTKADGGKPVQTSSEAKAASGGSGTQSQEAPADMSAAELKTEMAELRNRLENLTRENRSYAALRAQLDKVQNELKARGATQAPNPALTPEQQTQADAEAKATEYLKKFLNENIDPVLQQKYGPLLQMLQKQQSQESQNQFKGSVENLAKEMGIPFQSEKAEDFPLNPILGKLINADLAVYESDPAAKARIDRIIQNWEPHELFNRALLERSRAIQAAGVRVQQKQEVAAKGGQRALKAGGAKPEEKTKYSAEDLGAMSEEEREKAYADDPEAFEAAIPKQARR